MEQNDVKIYLERTGTQLIYTPLNLFNRTRFHFLQNLCQSLSDLCRLLSTIK